MSQIYWYTLDVVSKLFPIILAAVALAIAFTQWRTADRKLRLDLLDRRYKIYLATKRLLSRIGDMKDSSEGRKEIRLFMQRTSQASFLFDESIVSFLKEAERGAIKMLTNKRQREQAKARQVINVSANEDEDKNYLWAMEKDKLVRDLMIKYMDFSQIREINPGTKLASFFKCVRAALKELNKAMTPKY